MNKEIKEKVINGMIVRLTFDGAFKRSKIYGSYAPDEKRKEFRDFLASELLRILSKIQRRKRYNDSDHSKMIKKLSSDVSKRFSKILDENRFRIGNAQKFLNLYWKMAWLIKKNIVKPIHCPFDSIIIGRLPKNVHVAWTKFDTIEEYTALVEAAKVKARKSTAIADWEMETFWNDNYAEKGK